ncbi:MAG: hypothetical protein IKZ19_05595, partial [Clostridia bacterium]|nr:hypothetical protein [Clostridia bacterium]
MYKKLFLILILLGAAVLSACGTAVPEVTTSALPQESTAPPVLSAPDQSVNSLFALPYSYNEN